MTRQQLLSAASNWLAFAAKLQDHIDKARGRSEAGDIKRGRPPTERELEARWEWEAMVEDQAWDDFYGPPPDGMAYVRDQTKRRT